MNTVKQCIERLRAAGFSDTQIAKRAGIAVMTVYRARRAKVRRVREETREKLFEAAAKMLEERRRRDILEAKVLGEAQP